MIFQSGITGINQKTKRVEGPPEMYPLLHYKGLGRQIGVIAYGDDLAFRDAMSSPHTSVGHYVLDRQNGYAEIYA